MDKRTIQKREYRIVSEFTSKALIRSSLEWEADMHMRARASSRGVAGKATVTTATCGSTFISFFDSILEGKKELGNMIIMLRTYVVLKALPWESRDFGRIVKHNRHYWGIIIPKNFKSHFLQFRPKKVAVFSYSSKFLGTYMETEAFKLQQEWSYRDLKNSNLKLNTVGKVSTQTSTRTILPKDDLYGRYNLFCRRWWYWSCIKMRRASILQVLNKFLKIKQKFQPHLNIHQTWHIVTRYKCLNMQ